MQTVYSLILLKLPIPTTADDILKYFVFVFSGEIRLDISCESSARQTIHMKFQVLFSHIINTKKYRISSGTILLGALRVNCKIV